MSLKSPCGDVCGVPKAQQSSDLTWNGNISNVNTCSCVALRRTAGIEAK